MFRRRTTRIEARGCSRVGVLLSWSCGTFSRDSGVGMHSLFNSQSACISIKDGDRRIHLSHPKPPHKTPPPTSPRPLSQAVAVLSCLALLFSHIDLSFVGSCWDCSVGRRRKRRLGRLLQSGQTWNSVSRMRNHRHRQRPRG